MSIPRGEYLAELDRTAGQPVLTKMVFTELVSQAAAKAGVTPTPAQIDARIAEMQRRGQAAVVTPEQRDGLALAMAVENLRIVGITASNAEIADVYKRNTAQLAQPAQMQSILVATQSAFAAQTAASLLAKGETAPRSRPSRICM